MAYLMITISRKTISMLLCSSALALKTQENKSINQHIEATINITYLFEYKTAQSGLDTVRYHT